MTIFYEIHIFPLDDPDLIVSFLFTNKQAMRSVDKRTMEADDAQSNEGLVDKINRRRSTGTNVTMPSDDDGEAGLFAKRTRRVSTGALKSKKRQKSKADRNKSSYRKGVAKNNSGVLEFEAGNFEKARDCFKAAVQRISEIESLTQSDTTQRKGKSSDESPGKNIISFEWAKNPVGASASSAEEAEEGSFPSYVYKHALSIVVTIPNKSKLCVPTRPAKEEAFVVMYNLALSYHMLALQQQHNQEDGGLLLHHFRKAIRFYKLAFAISTFSGADEDGQYGSDAQIFTMAIWNNLGCVYRHLANYKAASRCFGSLFRELEGIAACGDSDFLEKTDCQGFLGNLLLHSPKEAGATTA